MAKLTSIITSSSELLIAESKIKLKNTPHVSNIPHYDATHEDHDSMVDELKKIRERSPDLHSKITNWD